MAVSIRLSRFGKKHQPFYRIVVMDKRKKRDGKYIEKIGYYNPLVNPPDIKIDKEKFQYWINKGAALSEGISKLFKNKKKLL